MKLSGAVAVHTAVRRASRHLEQVLALAERELPPAESDLVRFAIWDLNECADRIRQLLDQAHRRDQAAS